MAIAWNKVTWYSKLLAIIVFAGTFVLAFWLGTLWREAQLGAAVYKCGVAMNPWWTEGMTVVTRADDGKTIALTKNERFAIRLGDDLEWTLAFSPDGNIVRVPNTIDTGGFQGVYEAVRAGTTTLYAVGRPFCPEGAYCAQYLVEVNLSFETRED